MIIIYKKKSFIIFTLILIIALFSGIMFLGRHKSKLNLNKLPLQRVKVTIEKDLNTKLKEKKIDIKYNNKGYIINCSDIDLRYDVDNIRDNFENVNNLKVHIKRLLGLHDYQLSIVYDSNKLMQLLKSVREQLYIQPKNASISIENNILKIKPEVLGRDIDFVKIKQLITDSAETGESIELPVKEIYPKYLKSDFEKISGIIGTTTTRLYSKNYNRTCNIKLALSRLNNLILYPNETLSLNKILGDRTVENGYKMAPVIINNEMDSGIGGGVCQVASTLYKASLLSCLKIQERRSHSIPSQYIPMGQDATLVQNYVDLKITNNTGIPILFEGKLVKNSVMVNIYGSVISSKNVKLESHLDKVIQPQPPEVVLDSLMFMGESKVVKEAKNGYKVSVYRKIYQDDNLVRQEKISVDYYPPSRSKVAVGIR